MTSPARQTIDPDRIKPAVGAKDDQAVGRLGGDGKSRRVTVLVFLLRRRTVVPLDRANPSLRGTQHGDRLAFNERRDRDLDRLWRGADLGSPASQRRVAAKFGCRRFHLISDRAPLPLLARQ